MQKFHIVFSMHGIVNDTLEEYAKDDNFVLEQCTGLKDKKWQEVRRMKNES